MEGVINQLTATFLLCSERNLGRQGESLPVLIISVPKTERLGSQTQRFTRCTLRGKGLLIWAIGASVLGTKLIALEVNHQHQWHLAASVVFSFGSCGSKQQQVA